MAPSEWYSYPTKMTFNEWRYTNENREIIELKLTKGKTAVFSAEFKHDILKCKWYAMTCRGLWYAAARTTRTTLLLMHRVVLDVTQSSQTVDHNDGNGLNNVLSNLVVGSQQQNMCNRKLSSNNTSGENGIRKVGNNRWVVRWYEDKKEKRKSFGFGAVSEWTEQEALEAAKAFRDEVYERIGNRNGIRPK